MQPFPVAFASVRRDSEFGQLVVYSGGKRVALIDRLLHQFAIFLFALARIVRLVRSLDILPERKRYFFDVALRLPYRRSRVS
jgi:hypothetical protein